MTQIFENPQEFYLHLQSKVSNCDELSDDVRKNLLLASVHVIEYLLQSQSVLSEKIYNLVDCLNNNHETWGHKLAEVYTILEAADVTPEQMNKILLDEICHKKENDHGDT